MITTALTAKQAYEIASQWGSMMHAGDPGYVFYTFASNKAIVQDEDHRRNLIWYTEDCLKVAKSDNYTPKERKQNLKDLTALKAYFEAATLPHPELDEFTKAYVTAALWSETDESTESGGEPFDNNYSQRDISAKTMAKIVADCAKFQIVNKDLIKDENFTGSSEYSVSGRAGHDFWLTRNHHGCGFWDGDWEEVAGEILTKSAQSFGEANLYVGDDGKIYS